MQLEAQGRSVGNPRHYPRHSERTSVEEPFSSARSCSLVEGDGEVQKAVMVAQRVLSGEGASAELGKEGEKLGRRSEQVVLQASLGGG